MRLFYSPFHKFVHKVLVVLAEAGLQNDVETVPSFPFRNLEGVWVTGQYDTSTLNPLGKVPFLVLDNGTVLYSSQVVCEYLDSLSATPLYPPSGARRFDALRRLALGDAIFEFAVQMRMEDWRDSDDRRSDVYAWLWPKIDRSMHQLDNEASTWSGFDIGHAGLLQGVSYLDAWLGSKPNLPGKSFDDWRIRWPDVAGWYSVELQRPSVQAHYRVAYRGDTSADNHAAAVAAALRDREPAV